tara:strand:- start:166 stop:1083 length:918 start_codon:yes stop_codon:yes gene_type:complete
MKSIVLVAGGTGDLGQRIVKFLLKMDAEVRVISRAGRSPIISEKLQKLGAHVIQIQSWDENELSKACIGVNCVVSALSGLRDVIYDAQKTLLDAAIVAGVPRFIPSDYSIDFTKFPKGSNRNLDWRREFHLYLDKSSITATSIFNGAFAELLNNEMPMILYKINRIMYWGNADQRMDFTTMDNAAEFTAKVAVDFSTPRYLRIAGSQLSPREIKEVAEAVTGNKFKLLRPGDLGLLSFLIKVARTIAPGKDELYPAWQGMQYMRNMLTGKSHIQDLDNQRYDEIKWTSVKEVLNENQLNNNTEKE